MIAPNTPAKGEQTRQRILDGATRMFADASFDKVSLRAVARSVGVDPALISHYFGSKEGLFDAVLEGALQPERAESLVGEQPREEWGRSLVRYADTIWSGAAGRPMLAVARRALAGHPEMMSKFASRVILPRISGVLDGPEEERRLRASLAGSQMVGFIMARHVMRIEPLASLTTDAAVDLIGPTIQRYLTGDLTQS